VKFEYQAVDENGGVVRGVIEASNAQKVLQILLHKQLHPLDIRHLTDTTVELGRLHSLKNKLEGKAMDSKPISPQPIKVEQAPEPKQSRIDWTYVVFMLLMSGLIAVAIYLG